MMNSGLAYTACLFSLVMYSCQFRLPTDTRATQLSVPTSVATPQTSKPSGLIDSGVFDNNSSALEAWKKFIESGKYRAATANDFNFSDLAKNHLRDMFEEGWYARVDHPAITGNISRRHGFKDLAVIVVDASRSDSNRFSVVIFDFEPDNKETTSVHWLLRDRNLSSAILSWHANWPVLVFYHQDGSSDPYYINWNEATKAYFLDKEQIGPDARPARLRDRAE